MMSDTKNIPDPLFEKHGAKFVGDDQYMKIYNKITRLSKERVSQGDLRVRRTGEYRETRD
jgi:hypothetical protein